MGCGNDCGCGSCCPGPQGEKGDNGNQGIQGVPGPQGATGASGSGGSGGNTGAPGADGFGYDASSSNTIGILGTAAATVNFTIDNEKAYTPGARVRVSDIFNPTVNYFEGICTAYNSITGAITVSAIDVKSGAGTHSSWSINVAGEIGISGPTGTTGIQGPLGLTGPQGITGSTGGAGPSGVGYDLAVSTDAIDLSILGGTLLGITTTVNKAWTIGSRVRFTETANPGVIYFEGVVSSYVAVTGLMDLVTVGNINGATTPASWNISIIGDATLAGGAAWNVIGPLDYNGGFTDNAIGGHDLFSYRASDVLMVDIRGSVDETSAGDIEDVLILPLAVRPSAIRSIPALAYFGFGGAVYVPITVIILPSGQVSVSGDTGIISTCDGIVFDGVRYSL